jgi:hypothetical protein
MTKLTHSPGSTIVLFALSAFAALVTVAAVPQALPLLSSYVIEADTTDANAYVSAAAQIVAQYVAAAATGSVNAAPLPIFQPGGAPADAPVIAVGFKASARLSPSVPPGGWTSLGLEGHLLVSGLGSGGFSVVATGNDGAPRGTLYAAIALIEALGVHFWAPGALSLPAAPVTTMPVLSQVYMPPLEYRSTDNWQVQGPGFGEWSLLLRENDAQDGSDAKSKAGGGVEYASPPGFGNNADEWVSPSDPVGKLHPEWFGGSSQLCYTAPGLIDYLILRARYFMTQSPAATILTLAQNDNQNYCKTQEEQDVIDAEGGAPSAPLLRAINAIAANMSGDFPTLAIDTLAYQYTRKAPNTTVPRSNTIVRLCNIECNFRLPLSDTTDPTNAAFAKDLTAWAGISKRLYIWDYIVNFANTVMPWPNYDVLGPNIRYLLNNSVKGIFEEGQYWAYGGELQEMRSYLVLKLMYNPSLNQSVLTTDFLNGFYGAIGAPTVAAYIANTSESAAETNFFLGIFVSPTSTYLTPALILQAVASLANAAAASPQPYSLRLQTLWLAPTYVALLRWNEMKAWASANGIPWPLSDTALHTFADFADVYNAAGMNATGRGALSEGGHDLPWLLKQL